MRTTKRFTHLVLDRFHRQGRGKGTFKLYKPWHQVTRGDPASQGRSHLIAWFGRLRHLLSDGEWDQQLLATMLQNLVDSLEQLSLDLDAAPHPLCRYTLRASYVLYPGTRELAKELGIKHPITRDKNGENTTSWVMSTDLLLILVGLSGEYEMLALSFKPKGRLTKRAKEKLRLEREYWLRRGVEWLLITPDLYDERARLTLHRIAPWALDDEAHPQSRAAAVAAVKECPWASFTSVLHAVTSVVGCKELAQRAIWQAVWKGELPIDLTRGWRPHLPLTLVSPDEFANFNPILKRRSAWSA